MAIAKGVEYWKTTSKRQTYGIQFNKVVAQLKKQKNEKLGMKWIKSFIVYINKYLNIF